MHYMTESGIYVDYSPNTYDFKGVIESIKEIPNKLKEYISKVQENSYKILNEASERYSEAMTEFMYPYMVDDMFRKTDNIAHFLKITNLSNEYHSFLEIKRMMKVIFKDNLNDNNKNELKFLENVLSEFISLIDVVFDMCDSIDDLKELYESENENYISEYKIFERNFFDYKLKFYTEIATQNEDYEAIIRKMYSAVNL